MHWTKLGQFLDNKRRVRPISLLIDTRNQGEAFSLFMASWHRADSPGKLPCRPAANHWHRHADLKVITPSQRCLSELSEDSTVVTFTDQGSGGDAGLPDGLTCATWSPQVGMIDYRLHLATAVWSWHLSNLCTALLQCFGVGQDKAGGGGEWAVGSCSCRAGITLTGLLCKHMDTPSKRHSRHKVMARV